MTHYECGSDEVTKAQRNGSNLKVQINYLKMSWKINGWDKNEIFVEIYSLSSSDRWGWLGRSPPKFWWYLEWMVPGP